MRCAVIEISGNMICDLVQQEEQTETTKGQTDSFFDLLEERALDVNPYCRSKLFQVYLRLLKYSRPTHKLIKVFLQSSLRGVSESVSSAYAAWKIRAVMFEET
jgi:condensin complex subunit 1